MGGLPNIPIPLYTIYTIVYVQGFRMQVFFAQNAVVFDYSHTWWTRASNKEIAHKKYKSLLHPKNSMKTTGIPTQSGTTWYLHAVTVTGAVGLLFKHLLALLLLPT